MAEVEIDLRVYENKSSLRTAIAVIYALRNMLKLLSRLMRLKLNCRKKNERIISYSNTMVSSVFPTLTN